jgi:enterochelin esterase-like enzyme
MTRRKFSRYHYVIPALLLWLTPTALVAQSPPDANYVRGNVYASYNDFKADLNGIVAMPAGAARDNALDSFFSTLQAAGQVPYAQGSQTALLYRHPSATSVAFPGDHTGWSSSSSSATATRLGTTDVWIKEHTFPTDARLDYKVVANGSWILDPKNPLQMWGGFGPNNELRMPDYDFPQETVRHTGGPFGTFTPNIRTTSTNLDYDVNYRVYTPAGYDQAALSNLPVVYITDGHEFAADHLGSVVVTLDNLINSHELRPTIAVFIDPRDPDTGTNKRGSEYTGNINFANFVADELTAIVDAAYRTDATAAGRTILGTSLGGGNAAYFGLTRSDIFENIAPLSPSNTPSLASVYNQFASAGLQSDLNFFLTYGTIGDGNGGPNLNNILNANGYNLTRTTASEGHSWGNWRAQIKDILTGLVGAPLMGDPNGDGFVGIADLNLVLANWNQNVTPNNWLLGEFTGDGFVGIADLNIVLGNWNAGTPPPPPAAGPTVPEPATLSLLAIISLGAIGRRR